MSVISGFHHVSLTVRNLATSAEWYRTVLASEELFREDGEQRQAVILVFRVEAMPWDWLPTVEGPRGSIRR